MREFDENNIEKFWKEAQKRTMKDLWDDDIYDSIAWTQKFVFDYTNETKEGIKNLNDRILNIITNLSDLRNLHTKESGHTKFSLLKTSEMSKELIMTFYYECLECLQ